VAQSARRAERFVFMGITDAHIPGRSILKVIDNLGRAIAHAKDEIAKPLNAELFKLVLQERPAVNRDKRLREIRVQRSYAAA
jgi:hypothetical protein